MKHIMHSLLIILLTTAYAQTANTIKKIPVSDTSIVLVEMNNIIDPIDLTSAKAKRILYKHFKAKGYWNEYDEQRKDYTLTTDEDTLVISFQELHMLKVNGVRCGLVCYWVTPYLGSSHCYQPHKAVIVKHRDGYHVCNEEFIPDRYSVDKIIATKTGSVISVFDYDCGNHINRRKLNIHLHK